MSTESVTRKKLPWSARVAFALSLAVLILGVSTVVRWIGPAVALQYDWKPGDVTRDRMTMSMAFGTTPAISEQEFEMKLEMTSVTRVLSVDSQGNATLELSMEDVRLLESNLPPGGGDPTQKLSQTHTLVVAPDGRILESSNPLLGPEAFGDQGFGTTPLLPDEPVAPGDTWTIDYEQGIGIGEGGFDLHADNELIRYDEVNGVETVVIHSDLSGPMDFTIRPSEIPSDLLPEGTDLQTVGNVGDIHYTGELSMSADSWVDPLTGEVLRSDAVGESSVSFGFSDLEIGLPRFGLNMEMEMETLRLP
ncbi:MAG: hypothetical protein ACRDH9_13435 [Actinomycetota bacterium]